MIIVDYAPHNLKFLRAATGFTIRGDFGVETFQALRVEQAGGVPFPRKQFRKNLLAGKELIKPQVTDENRTTVAADQLRALHCQHAIADRCRYLQCKGYNEAW